MPKDKLIPTNDEEIMEITLSPTAGDRDIELQSSDFEHQQDRGRQKSPKSMGLSKRKAERSSGNNSSTSRDRAATKDRAGTSGGTSEARGSRPQEDLRKRRPRGDETQEKRKRDPRDEGGWTQSQLELLKERIQVISGAALLYEILLSQHPATFNNRQHLLSTALLHSFLQNAARKAVHFKNPRNLQLKEIEELNRAISIGQFGLDNVPEQWKSVNVQGVVYKHAETFAFWRDNPRQLPHALTRMHHEMRAKYSLRDREEGLKRAEQVFGISTTVTKLDKPRLYNPFDREFTDPDPGSPDCLTLQLTTVKHQLTTAKNQLTTAKAELAKMKSGGQQLEEANQKIEKLQQQLTERTNSLNDIDGEVVALRSQLEKVMNERADWLAEREQMVDESNHLHEEHSNLIREHRMLQEELQAEKARPRMVEQGELTALIQRLIPAGYQQSPPNQQSPPRRVVEERSAPAAGRNRIISESDVE